MPKRGLISIKTLCNFTKSLLYINIYIPKICTRINGFRDAMIVVNMTIVIIFNIFPLFFTKKSMFIIYIKKQKYVCLFLDFTKLEERNKNMKYTPVSQISKIADGVNAISARVC